jgi:DNA-binding transcriptional LysR family regulator
MDLNSLIVFKKIADFGSITKAALDLKLPKSAVSQRLSRLEEELGGRLIQRSTRSLALTEFGESIYRHAALISEQRDVMIDLVASSSDSSAGLIRMTAPPDMGPWLIRGVLKRFMEEHPAIRIELDLSTRYVDLTNEGYDLALRASVKGLEDSNLIATKLQETTIRLFASAHYCNENTRPTTPDDLKKQRIVALNSAPGGKIYHLKLRGKNHEHATVNLTPTFSSTNYQGVYEAIKSGIGIGLLPEDLCEFDVKKGTISEVLPEWNGGQALFYAVYPSKKFLPIRVKSLLSFLAETW